MDSSESESSVGRMFRRFLDGMDRMLNPEPEQPASPTPTRLPDAVYHDAVYGSEKIDMHHVHGLALAGVPAGLRAVYWKLMRGYLPPERDHWPDAHESSRESYKSFCDLFIVDPERAAATDHVCPPPSSPHTRRWGSCGTKECLVMHKHTRTTHTTPHHSH